MLRPVAFRQGVEESLIKDKRSVYGVLLLLSFFIMSVHLKIARFLLKLRKKRNGPMGLQVVAGITFVAVGSRMDSPAWRTGLR